MIIFRDAGHEVNLQFDALGQLMIVDVMLALDAVVSPYGGRVVNPEGFVDAWVHAGNREDAGVTADMHGRPVRLDYCFVSAALAPAIRACTIDAAAAGSDHQPVWLELAL